jgi:heptosyltransferase-2
MARVCIIKLGALGDVLRTTCILPGLWEKYGRPQITWITKAGAAPLLENNPYIDRILTPATGPGERYDLTICLDEEPEACRLASALQTDERFGAYTDWSGALRYTMDSAPWFRLGLLGPAERDALKKANTRTYPALLYDMLRLPGNPARPLLRLAPRELERGKTFLPESRPHIGLNTGAGGRWKLKKLSEAGAIQLARELQQEDVQPLLLLGGPEERERNARIHTATGVHAVPTNLSIREFAAVIASLRLLVTSDSLALHMALALEIPAVVFFGPTSAAEIELYGRGRKVLPRTGFQCFYTERCLHTPSCETFQSVSDIVEATLAALRPTVERRRVSA